MSDPQSAAARAALLFSKGCNCSQAVLTALAPGLGLDEATARNIALGFGGGIARSGATCGAVTGGIMALGCARGSGDIPGDGDKEEVYALVQDFLTAFRARHGSTECRRLTGLDLSDAAERRKAHEQGLFDDLCPRLVQDAVRMVQQLL